MSRYEYVALEDPMGSGYTGNELEERICNIDGEIVECIMRNGWTIGLVVDTSKVIDNN